MKKSEIKVYDCMLNGNHVYSKSKSPEKAFENFKHRGIKQNGFWNIVDMRIYLDEKPVKLRYKVINGCYFSI